VLSVAIVPAWAGTVIYVDDDAPLGGDGMSWDTAYRFLQDGLADANNLVPEPVDIYVGQGVYRPDQSELYPEGTGDITTSFVLAGHMSLKGGYVGLESVDAMDPNAPDPNTSDPSQYPSVLSGDLTENDANDILVSDLRLHPTREDNALHVMVVTGWRRPSGGGYSEEYFWSNASMIEGLTVTGGNARGDYLDSKGGGITVVDGYVIIKKCSFESNDAAHGGGLYVNEAVNVRVVSCLFVKNQGYWGGGVYCAGSEPSVLEAKVEFIDCEFNNNWAEYAGGGLRLRGTSEVILTGCRVSENFAVALGGGLASRGDHYIGLFDTYFDRNFSAGAGGALNAFFSGSVEASNCLFTGNWALINGGAVSYRVDKLSLVNCTAQGNRAELGRFLGGRFFDSQTQVESVVTVENCIIDDGGCEIWDEGNLESLTVRYCNIPDEGAHITFPARADVIWGPGNVFVDPCFVASGYWDGGNTPDDPNDDMYIAGDYHLKSQAGYWDVASQSWINDDVTSLCIDAGDPNAFVGGEPMPKSDLINMGAYGGTAEASKSFYIKIPPDPNDGVPSSGGAGGGR